MAMKPNTLLVWNYLKEHADENLTAADVAEACNLEKKVVNGIFTAAFQRKNLGERIEDEVEGDDGSHSKVKYLKLNAEGLALDPDAE